MKRRDFIKTSSAFAAGGLLIPNTLFALKPKNYIGLQLYTIRDEVNKNLEYSLEKIANIGYNSVEAAGFADGKFYGLSPVDFRKTVNKFGMELHSTHNNFSLDQADMNIEAAVEAGIPYLVIPWLAPDKRKSIDSYKNLADEFNTIGEKCKNAGITFAYHNHAFEFDKIDGEIPYDLLLKETDKDLVKMQLDIYWIKKAGYSSIDYFKKYPGRFELWHIKDMDNTPAAENIETGNGIIDFKEIFKYKEVSGMKKFFIELDNCVLPSYECVKVSYDYLKGIL